MPIIFCLGRAQEFWARVWLLLSSCIFGTLRYTLSMNIILYMVGRWRYIACSC